MMKMNENIVMALEKLRWRFADAGFKQSHKFNTIIALETDFAFNTRISIDAGFARLNNHINTQALIEINKLFPKSPFNERFPVFHQWMN